MKANKAVDLRQAIKAYRALRILLEAYAKASPNLQDNIQATIESLCQTLEERINVQ